MALIPSFSNCLFLLFFLLPQLLYPEVQPQHYFAKELTSVIKFNGIPDDLAWKSATVADSFIQLDPSEGALISQKTEVRVLYDKTAVYVLAIIYLQIIISSLLSILALDIMRQHH